MRHFHSKVLPTVMETTLLPVFQMPCLMSMVHQCSLGCLTPPSRRLSMPHFTQAPPQVSIPACCKTKFGLISLRSIHVPVTCHPKCCASKCVSPSRLVFANFLNVNSRGDSSTACSMTMRDLLDLPVLSSTMLHNQRYIILVIRRYFPLTLLFTCLQ
jgi:hypothetical protein